jgi:hypothetical protein
VAGLRLGLSTGNGLGMAPDVIIGGDCNWIIVTQLLGEVRCSLPLGHDGDHRFEVEQVAAYRGDSHPQSSRASFEERFGQLDTTTS